MRDARLGWYDSLGGLTGASLDSMRVGVQFMQWRTLGHTATLSVTALQFGSALAGAFGGFLNAYVSNRKASRAKEQGLMDIAALHHLASASAFGGGVVGGLVAFGHGADVLVMRRIGGEVVKNVAKRAAAIAMAEVMGVTVPVVGWGLLALGVGSTIWAAVLEPSMLEAWARQTPFGAAPQQEKFKGLKEMQSALMLALARATGEVADQKGPSGSQESS